MNKRRSIYKGFNKRRKNRVIKIYIVGASICLICGYGYIQFKNSNMFNSIKEKVASIELKAPFFDLKKSNDNGLETVDYNDISKEIDKIKEENNEAKTDDVKVVAADSTVQKTPKSLSLAGKAVEFYEGDTFTLGTSAELVVTYEDSTSQILEETNTNLSFTIDGKKLNIGDKLIASEHNGKKVIVSYTENGTTKNARGVCN
mgnify:CR=1 FL=1